MNLLWYANVKVLSSAEFPSSHDCVVMEGTGPLLLESVISTAVPANGKLLVIRNGEAGERIKQIAEVFLARRIVKLT